MNSFQGRIISKDYLQAFYGHLNGFRGKNPCFLGVS